MPLNQSTATEVGRPATPIEAAATGVQHNIGTLGNALDHLAHRLDSVLQPVRVAPPAPQAAGSGKLSSVEQPHSAVVNDMYAMSSYLEGLIAKVDELVSRLDT